MGVFWIIFITGVFVAITQIILSNSDIKNPDSSIPWPKNVRVQGWLFYLLTIVLAILPAIQYAIQENSNKEKEKENYDAQEARDERLRNRYDSSLLVMKNKFDTSTAIVSETLGKYGYKLDSTNKVLINIRQRSALPPISPIQFLISFSLTRPLICEARQRKGNTWLK